MSMSRAKDEQAHQEAVTALREAGLMPPLTPEQRTVEMRLKLVGLAYRPDWSSPQIIARCQELETYIVGGQPE